MAGRIAGITIEIDGDTKKLQTALKGVDSQIRTTQNSLKDINKLLKLDPKNTELLTQKQKALQQAIQQTKDRLKQLKEAQSQVKEGTEEWDALQREIVATEQELKKLEKEFKNFGSVGAQQVAAVGEKMKTIGEKMSAVGKTLTTNVTLPIVAVGTMAAKSFAEVDKTMQLTNATMNNTTQEANELNSAMEKAAAQSIFTMEDAAKATLNFARAGLDAKEAAAVLAPAMNLAAGEGGNLDTVSAGLVATINGFQDSFEKAADYADVFAAACNNSALDVDSLSSSMATAAPVFNAAGYTVRDAALYMGVMANNGIGANEAANSLKTGFARLITPTKAAGEWLDRFNWSIVDGNGNMKDTLTIQRELHDSFSTLSEEEQIAAASAIFGKNQMAKWLALINTAPEEVRELADEIDHAKGKTDEMSKAMMSGFGGSIERLKSSINVLATSLGRIIAEIIQPFINGLQKIIDKFNGLSDGTKKVIVVIAMIVAAIGPLLLIGGKLLTGIGMLLTFAPVVTAAIGGISAPVLIVIGAIAALIAIGVLLYKNWDEIREWAEKTWKSITDGWNTFMERLSTAFTTFGTEARKSFQMTWQNIQRATLNAWNNIKVGVYNRVTELKNNISQTFDNIRNKVQNIVQRLKDLMNFQWSLPHLAIPHLSVWGHFSINPPSVPHFSIEWYKKAYQNPVMFTSPTVLQTPYGAKGFGDGNGGEVVLGMNKLRELVGGATGDNISINVYATPGMNVNELADKIQDRLVALQKQRSLAYGS